MPPPDHDWIKKQAKQLRPTGEHIPKGGPKNQHLLRERKAYPTTGDPIVPARMYKNHPVEVDLGREDWAKVYEAFGITGSVPKIAAMVELTEPQVNYLLDNGLNRLNLPSIRDHAIDDAEVQRTVDMVPDLRNSENLSLQMQEVQQAVTRRTAQEASVAKHNLNIVAQTNQIMQGWVNQILKIAAQQAYARPKQINQKLISDLVRAIDTLSKATNTAVKTLRLTAGEPTDIVTHQIAVMMASCTDSELEEMERTGSLPSRIMRRLPQEEQRRQEIIDVDVHSERQE